MSLGKLKRELQLRTGFFDRLTIESSVIDQIKKDKKYTVEEKTRAEKIIIDLSADYPTKLSVRQLGQWTKKVHHALRDDPELKELERKRKDGDRSEGDPRENQGRSR